ncbi:MAG: hypothetical protein IPP48_11475 [Chitinophagaceae bacterium]|nr:hypothetical protein [Chitinophagaceae bacterium]
MWLGFVNKGVLKINLSDLSTVGYFEKIKHESVSFITKDTENGLWISTLNKGIYYLKRTSISVLEDGAEVKGQQVFNLFNGGNKSLIFSNPTGLFQVNNSHAKKIVEAQARIIRDIKISETDNTVLIGGSLLL